MYLLLCIIQAGKVKVTFYEHNNTQVYYYVNF